jgi:hypothetical protein
MKQFHETHNGKTVYFDEIADIGPIQDDKPVLKKYVIRLKSGQSVNDYSFQFVKQDHQEQHRDWEELKAAFSAYNQEKKNLRGLFGKMLRLQAFKK